MPFTGIDIHYQSVSIVDSVSPFFIPPPHSYTSLFFSSFHMVLPPPLLFITKQISAGASAVSWEDWWTYEGISGEPINLIDLPILFRLFFLTPSLRKMYCAVDLHVSRVKRAGQRCSFCRVLSNQKRRENLVEIVIIPQFNCALLAPYNIQNWLYGSLCISATNQYCGLQLKGFFSFNTPLHSLCSFFSPISNVCWCLY
jgi:ABC-type transporter Mla MlaB component